MAVKGLAKLRRQLAALPRLQVEAAARALAQNADELVGAMRRAVPKRHGALAASIGWRKASQAGPDAPPTERQNIVGAEGLALMVYAGDDKAFYARWVEFGTAASPAKGAKAAHRATPAEPFFFPTVRASKAKMKARVIREARKAAKAAAAVS